jgi:SAM-dependent methyltransferase
MNPRVVIPDIPKLYPADYAPHATTTSVTPQIQQDRQSRMGGLLTNESIPAEFASAITPQSRVLDVGCGNGRFLKRVQDFFGCQVEGVDLSGAAIAAVRNEFGINAFHGCLEDAAFPSGHFDMVTAWWYLEHVPSPVEALSEMSRVLKSRGVCIFGVPNTRSLAARLFRSHWYHLDSPRHLILFSPRSIETMLPLAGLRMRSISFDKTPWGLIGSLAYAAGGNGDTARRWRRKFLLRQILYPLTIVLGLLGWGDTMVVRAEKI